MKIIDKQEALDSLNHVIKDCNNFTEWDTTDAHNFEAMNILLKRVREYVRNRQP